MISLAIAKPAGGKRHVPTWVRVGNRIAQDVAASARHLARVDKGSDILRCALVGEKIADGRGEKVYLLYEARYREECENKGNGKMGIRDPNSPANSHIDWDLDRILSQCRNLWVYSL